MGRDPQVLAALDEAIGPGRMQGDPIPEPEMLVDGLAERGYIIVPASVLTEMDEWLSRVLFEAREQVAMLRDLVESRSGQQDGWSRRLIGEIDEFRRSQGWPEHGFGGEAKLTGRPGLVGFLDSGKTGEQPIS